MVRGIGIRQQWLENLALFDWAFATVTKRGYKIDRIDPERIPENQVLNQIVTDLNKRAYGKSGALWITRKPDGSYQALVGLKGKGYSGYSKKCSHLLENPKKIC